MNKDFIKQHNGDGLPNYLIGKTILKVEKTEVRDDYGLTDGYRLYCSDNTILEIGLNKGCCGCSNGWSEIELMKLNDNQNVITNVKYEKDTTNEDYKWDDDAFTLFIYYQDNQINEISGTDGYGNGYYGGGFYVNVISIESKSE